MLFRKIKLSFITAAVAASSLTILLPVHNAAAGVCVGYCDAGGADGVVTLSPSGNSSYQYVSTHNGVAGAGQIAGVGGFDLAAIDRDFDLGSVALDIVEAALDAGLEQRPQALACVTLQQRLDRRAGDRAQVRVRSRDGLLPFRTVEQLAGPIALDRLHKA